MATITIGPFLDLEIDRPRTINFEVPDEGELAKLPSFWNDLEINEVSFGQACGVGSNQWIQLRYVVLGRPILFCVFYLERRQEWVCIIFYSDSIRQGYTPRENSMSEPYEVNEGFIRHILQAYGVSSRIAITPEVMRCHPDVFRELGER